MPGGDRTGPEGLGPMTGRAAGYCAGSTVPGYANPAPRMGQGLGRGFRGGRGGWRGRRFAVDPIDIQGAAVGAITREQELDALRKQAEYLQSAIDDARRRIEELEKTSKK